MIFSIIIATLCITNPAQAKAPPVDPQTALWSVYTRDLIIDYYADKWGVEAKILRQVILCESSFDPYAVGDDDQSYGLAQIYMPVWGETISIEQATNPHFAINFMAEKISQNRGYLWTCWRKFNVS